MRHITDSGLQLIKQFEGFSSEIYICPGGYPTIGYGHLVRDDDKLFFDGGISKDKADDLLRRDIRSAERAVLRFISVRLSDGQFDALVSFTFNLGAGALQSSTLRRKINRQDHHEAPAQFKRWVWSNGRKLKGLQRRRNAEAALYCA